MTLLFFLVVVHANALVIVHANAQLLSTPPEDDSLLVQRPTCRGRRQRRRRRRLAFFARLTYRIVEVDEEDGSWHECTDMLPMPMITLPALGIKPKDGRST